MRIQNTNSGRGNLFIRFIMCGCSETPGTVVIAVHNKCGGLTLPGAPGLSYRNPFGRLLILSYGTAIGACTSFQAGEPELHRFAANRKTASEGNGRSGKIYGAPAWHNMCHLARAIIWRCNDEWLVSQV